MAMRKEPDRRYASVGQFAEDLRRYLDGYPVAARTDTRGYRAVKFLGRNKTAVLVGSLGVLALLAGIAATSWEAHIAERRFNGLRKLANSYLFEFHEAIKDLPGATPARQLVVKRALEYLDGLSQERGNDAALRLELATAYKRVGDVQGRPDYASLGDTAGALDSYRKALTLFERSSAVAAASTGAGSDMALCYSGMASILSRSGDLSGASKSLRKAVPIMEGLAAAHPKNLEVRDTLAEVYRQLADILGNSTQANLGDTKGAVTFYNKAVVIRVSLVAENPKDRLQRSSLAAVYGRLAMSQRSMADYAGALAAYRQSLKVDEQLEREDPDNATFRRNTANANRMMSLLSLDVGNLEDARKYADQSATLNARLVKDDPKDMEAREHLANSYFTQGTIMARSNDPVHAQQHFDSALAIYERLMAHSPGYLPGGLNSTYNLVAAMAIQTGDGGKAVMAARKQLQIADRLLRISAANEFARRNQGLALLQLGQGHELLARKSISEWREARSSYQQSRDVWLDLRNKGTLIPRYIPRLDEAAAAIARCDRALAK
jgi:tetratricopeptide (TPR) repeat protein